MAPSIRQGDRGPAVRDVQERLARILPSPCVVDGVFGPHTREAVREFQRQRGLAADGFVGSETWHELVEAGFALGDRLLWHSKRLLRGDDVRELQHRLNRLGFDAGLEDGIFGRQARAAIEEFQRNVGLPADGVVGPDTIDALRRLHRDHQSEGVLPRVREREWLRYLSSRGIVGARILVDPARGPDDPGHTGPSGTVEAEVTWELARRLAARLTARGAEVLLSRGPQTTPGVTDRAAFANEQGADIVLSLAVNGLATPVGRGASAYYFGSSAFISEVGQRLAELVLDGAVTAGWRPDCRAHAMTWRILRETRMPAVVLEPGFLTSPLDERRLVDPRAQDRLAAGVSDAVARFFEEIPMAAASEA